MKKPSENPITNGQMVSNYNVHIVSRDVIRYKFTRLSLSLLLPLLSSVPSSTAVNLFPVHTLTQHHETYTLLCDAGTSAYKHLLAS